jgi:conjugative transfer signal peptidase TraF
MDITTRFRIGHPRQMVSQASCLALGLCLLYATPSFLRLMWQSTPSEPQGLYRLRSLPPTLRRDMLVTFPVPASVADLVYAQGWLPQGWLLMKAVAALEGDLVCIHEEGVYVNGAWQAPVYRELGGVALPVLRGCWTLQADEVFLLSTKIPNSLDGRYFGLSQRTDLSFVAQPLWTWEP